ncbi:phytanoyl-CoA dioxygenase family protein [Kordiimonas laminariae]|uniref:phytanoyl-CoA dioxygenase family protein n=1 Tax=Kordiimonas laminariae TaxID=2917717 RepID=UPI001FF65CEC|nr:phytanoyl-CoA dioxygenase family protein [Kordiimonas laminariae]MCK0068709.1 phytanoyl-CoA dioxygenase family protein [Kordiimonas laminariae]
MFPVSGLTFTEHGAELIDDFLSPASLKSLQTATDTLTLTTIKGGLRNAETKIPLISKTIEIEAIQERLEAYLAPPLSLVRAIYFDKTTDQNWLVPWHQDLTIAVDRFFECEGWENWTQKEGIWHVQAPLTVLENMITVRIHLDDTDQRNGCLNIVPSSHALGRIPHKTITGITAQSGHTECVANAGSALIMKPHIIHSSKKGTKPSRRRIIHLEFSSFQLPEGVNWV